MIRKPIRSRLAAFSILLWSLTVSAAPPEMPVGIEHAQLMGTLTLKGQLFHVQGVEVDSEHIWVTSLSRLRGRGFIHQFDRATGAFQRRLELTDGPRYHPGGISVDGGSIWVPVAEMKPHSTSVLVEIDKHSFQVRRRINVADHLGCVAASGNTLIAGNWDSKQLHVFDLTGTEPARIVQNPVRTRFQDMKLIGGQLVAGGLLSGRNGSSDWFDWPSMRHLRRLKTGTTPSDGSLRPVTGFTGEGMTLEGRDLYLVPEDGPSRMFHFRLDTAIAGNL